MDIAIDEHGVLVSIESLRGMAVIPDFWCTGEADDGEECSAKVWVKNMQSTVLSPAFAAHHLPGCDHGSERSESDPGDAGHAHRQGVRPTRWVLRAGKAEPSEVPFGRRQPDESNLGAATRRYQADSALGETDSLTVRSFSTLLVCLLTDKLPSPLELVIGGKDPVDAAELIVHARDVSLDRLGTDVIIWGKVSGYSATQYDGYWLHLEDAADDVAILVDKEQLEMLRISDMKILVGRDVIAYGPYRKPNRLPHVRAQFGTLAFNPRVSHRRS